MTTTPILQEPKSRIPNLQERLVSRQRLPQSIMNISNQYMKLEMRLNMKEFLMQGFE